MKCFKCHKELKKKYRSYDTVYECECGALNATQELWEKIEKSKSLG